MTIVNQQELIQEFAKMKAYHFDESQTTQSLSAAISLDDINLDGCPQEVRDVTEEYRVKIRYYHAEQKTNMENEVDMYNTSPDKETAKKKLEETLNKYRAESKAYIEKTIDEYHAKLMDISEKYPEQRDNILKVADQVTGFAAHYVRAIADLAKDVADTVITTIIDIGKTVIDTISDIGRKIWPF
ncbi:hypothetical protein [Lysinibacillus sp. LZ02]|uniref:hypothetical protein n=1 Tax=Lysinibacillus sp. LZ02 TaxID=3420668 RepID=UPI003D36FD6E